MSDDDYDLQVLLELRERQKDEAEQLCADETQELERRESYLENKRRELEESIEERESERERLVERRDSGEASIGELDQFRTYLRGMKEDEADLRGEIERAEEAVDDQRQRVEEARERLAEATRELKAVERHREEWEEERDQREKRREASEMDDIATHVWRENQS